MTKPEQLPFDLGYRQAYEREDFWVSSSNRDAVALLDTWPKWSSHTLIVLGAKASGKTHLLQVWKQEANAVELSVADLAEINLVKTLYNTRCIAIDDAYKAIGNEDQEKVLLHIYNALKDKGGNMVLCFESPVKDYDFIVPDLKSRLMSLSVAAITPPDEELMAVMLTKMFSDRQIFVPQEVVQFILPRIERSFSVMRDLVEAIDHKALVQKKSVTIPLVKELIK